MDQLCSETSAYILDERLLGMDEGGMIEMRDGKE
jgi:hypothetical protein